MCGYATEELIGSNDTNIQQINKDFFLFSVAAIPNAIALLFQVYCTDILLIPVA